MLIDQLIQSIKEDIDSGNFTLQAVFDRHIDDIMLLKKEGYQYKRIWMLLGLDIHNEHFKNLIYRARAKKTKPDNSVFPESKKKAHVHTRTEVIADDISANTSPILSLDDWRFETGINNLSDRLIGRLEQKGLTPEKIKELNLTTTTLINKHLATIESQSKYK